MRTQNAKYYDTKKQISLELQGQTEADSNRSNTFVRNYRMRV